MMICIPDTTSRVLKNFNEGKNEHEKEISRKKLKNKLHGLRDLRVLGVKKY